MYQAPIEPNELETAGLIERRRRGQSMPNRIYIKIPDGQDIIRLMDKKLWLLTRDLPPEENGEKEDTAATWYLLSCSHCPECAVITRRRKEAERQRKRYYDSTHLGAKKLL